MRITESGNILFAEDFWDCECDKNFIHRTSDEPMCKICGFQSDEMPDARVSEIIIYQPELLTQCERTTVIEKYEELGGLVG